jgi:hypothetical protein
MNCMKLQKLFNLHIYIRSITRGMLSYIIQHMEMVVGSASYNNQYPHDQLKTHFLTTKSKSAINLLNTHLWIKNLALQCDCLL